MPSVYERAVEAWDFGELRGWTELGVTGGLFLCVGRETFVLLLNSAFAAILLTWVLQHRGKEGDGECAWERSDDG